MLEAQKLRWEARQQGREPIGQFCNDGSQSTGESQTGYIGKPGGNGTHHSMSELASGKNMDPDHPPIF
jgi:hypothetical protein